MSTKKEFTISRTINAPRDLVWKAWSDPKALGQWWGPKGCAIEVAKFEFKPGGLFHYSMTMQNGQKWWGRFIYREMIKPERIVFVNSFSDASGGVTRAPFSPLFPLEVQNNLTFTEQGGKTTLDLRGGPVNPTDEESAFFEGMFASMTQGFGGTFDQLEEFLAKA